MPCCFCCWHYSPLQQKCTYWRSDGLHVNADDECHFPNGDAFNNVCEFEDMKVTNEHVIRNFPLRDLASLVIRREYEEDIDYDWDENPFSWGYRTILVTSDGVRFDEYDYEDALEHECWWLQQEAVVAVKENLD